jgi:hypothetical protein
MSGDDLGSHELHAQQLRARVAAAGLLSSELRLGVLSSITAGPTVPEPYETLVRQISDDSSRVTDAQVQDVRDAAGSDKAAFELILTAAIGAGLNRWEAAQQAIAGAGDAAS